MQKSSVRCRIRRHQKAGWTVPPVITQQVGCNATCPLANSKTGGEVYAILYIAVSDIRRTLTCSNPGKRNSCGYDSRPEVSRDLWVGGKQGRLKRGAFENGGSKFMSTSFDFPFGIKGVSRPPIRRNADVRSATAAAASF